MINYIYDGTFEGLLTVIATALNQTAEEVNEISLTGKEQPDLFSQTCQVKTEPSVAAALFREIVARFSQPVVLDIGKCFLSEVSGIEKVILDFIRLLLIHGEPFSRNVANETVLRIRKISDRVGYEIIRFQGLVRFRKLQNGFYYAAIEPDHNIIQLLAPHFQARFADQLWLIHDLNRQSGVLYNRERCLFIPQVEIERDIVAACHPNPSAPAVDCFATEEYEFQKLWNQYFNAIAIPERTNPKLQRQHMPSRYWCHLVENVK